METTLEEEEGKQTIEETRVKEHLYDQKNIHPVDPVPFHFAGIMVC